MKHLMNKLYGDGHYDSEMFSEEFMEDFKNKGFKNFNKYNEMDKSRSKQYSSKFHHEKDEMTEKYGSLKEYCDARMKEHVMEHGFHLDKELLECGLLLLDFEGDEEPWSIDETEQARKNAGLHFDGEFSSVNKYDFNFIMNKRKVKDKYHGRSIHDIAYKTWETLTDDSFPYPAAKAYFIFLMYLYSTMAEKSKLFR